MWKSRKEEENPAVQPPSPAPVVKTPVAAAPVRDNRPVESPRMDTYRADVAHIGKSVVVKGELSGSEDLYLDGEVEGSIELRGHSLTIGPNGRVRANVHAKEVVVHGKVDGNVRGSDKVELKKSAQLNGDIFTQRIVIEDGAFFKGAIDIQKSETKQEPRKEAAAAASAPASSPATANAAFNPQQSLLDRK